MMRCFRFSAILLALASPSVAQSEIARIRGGEHADFTRIVIEAPFSGAWQFGRTEGGYGFRAGDAVTGFDLSQAFDKIPRSRISALRRDGETGFLQMDLVCACYAIAFEVRPGIVAIDVRNGLAPADSEYEKPLNFRSTVRGGNTAAPPPDFPVFPRIKAAPGSSPARAGAGKTNYDWLEIAGYGQMPQPDINEEEASDEAFFLLDPLRDTLLRQISRGILEGVVEPGSLEDLPEAAKAPFADAPGLRISNGEMPGLWAGTDRSPGPNLTAEGKPCLPDRMTDIATWLPDESPLAALSDRRRNLLTEFDQPVAANILDAARGHIALGFGAEARQILALLPAGEAESQAILDDLSYLVDLEPAPHGAFVGMESCDSPAALWAMLALAVAGGEAPRTTPDLAAITRSFSSLSQDLRRHLAPVLVAYFTAHGDETTARRLRDATLRAPGSPGQQVQLMDAGVELATGNAGQAAKIAEEVFTDPGNTAAEAAILLAESAFAGNRMVSHDLSAQLSALSAELRGSEEYPRIRRAEILALAMSGDYRSAFDLLTEAPGATGDLWELAAAGAPDEVLLTQALKQSTPPSTNKDTDRRVARRLLDFGFAQEALNWLGPKDALQTDPDRLLGAEAALAIRDARLAVRLLAGLAGDEADALRARAAIQLGNADAAAAILLASGDQQAALRAEFWAGDWGYIAQSDTAGLSPAAAMLLPPLADASGEGILARGNRLAGESESAREAVNGLLQAVPGQFP